MPVYKADEMEPTPDVVRPHIMMNQFGGELIKAGVVTYAAGDAPPPHVHPTDEQWIYVLEGQLATVLGDELEIIGPGDLVYISREASRMAYACSDPSVASSPVRAQPVLAHSVKTTQRFRTSKK